MNKINLKTESRAIIILLLTIAVSIWAYPQLPAQVASHWDFQGNINGWMGKDMHSIMFPLIVIGIYLLFLFMPYFDPKKERYTEFAGAYRIMRDAILFMLFGVFVTATLANLNYPINVGAVISALMGLLMLVLGNYFGKLKRNWFIGLRTPWTLSSENVWNKTHRLGGRLFMIWGLLIILAPWLNFQSALVIIFAGIAAIIVGVNVYSFLLFKKEKKEID